MAPRQQEQPRDRLLEHGPAALSNAELLAILLRTGMSGDTALDLARRALVHFSGLRGLLEAERDQFCGARGLGPGRWARLQAA